MTNKPYRLTDCASDNQRMYAEFRCSRIAELIASKVANLSYFDRVLDEVISLYALAVEGRPSRYLN